MSKEEFMILSDHAKTLYVHTRILELDSVELLRNMLMDLNLNQSDPDYLFLNYFEE